MPVSKKLRKKSSQKTDRRLEKLESMRTDFREFIKDAPELEAIDFTPGERPILGLSCITKNIGKGRLKEVLLPWETEGYLVDFDLQAYHDAAEAANNYTGNKKDLELFIKLFVQLMQTSKFIIPKIITDTVYLYQRDILDAKGKKLFDEVCVLKQLDNNQVALVFGRVGGGTKRIVAAYEVENTINHDGIFVCSEGLAFDYLDGEYDIDSEREIQNHKDFRKVVDILDMLGDRGPRKDIVDDLILKLGSYVIKAKEEGRVEELFREIRTNTARYIQLIGDRHREDASAHILDFWFTGCLINEIGRVGIYKDTAVDTQDPNWMDIFIEQDIKESYNLSVKSVLLVDPEELAKIWDKINREIPKRVEVEYKEGGSFRTYKSGKRVWVDNVEEFEEKAAEEELADKDLEEPTESPVLTIEKMAEDLEWVPAAEAIDALFR
jgi:hypothetical protein